MTALVNPEGPLGRSLYLAHVVRFEEWPESIDAPDPHFVVFVAADATKTTDGDLEDFARKLLDQGAAYLCAWGPDCERVHIRFDFADIERTSDPDEFVTTVDEAGESLDHALWFALYHTWPSGRYEASCKSLLAIAVANDEWNVAIRARLADPERLLDDLDLRD